MSLVQTITEPRSTASRAPAAEHGVVAVTAGETPIPRTAILRRAKRKAGRMRRYLAMASGYRTAKRQGSLPRPVFLVCQNRSGSTFLNRLFGAHPACWTYTEGAHQEAMNERDCPRWLSGQPYMRRWQIKSPSLIDRCQTPVWLAAMAQGHAFGIFKIPHALAKVVALQRIVPEARFVLLVRHPAAQVASALSRGNRPEHLRMKADVLIRFLSHEIDKVKDLLMVRYEDLLASPTECFGKLCWDLGMDANTEVIQNCVDAVGVRPGRRSEGCKVPLSMKYRIEKLCRLLGYGRPMRDAYTITEENHAVAGGKAERYPGP